jgi:hypothetical protein
VDRRRVRRRSETLRRLAQRTRWTIWTRRVSVDRDRFTHNPEVAGSNPAPATNFRRSRPFPGRGEGLCVSDAVVSPVVKAGLRAAWRRDRGDGMARDETAWTWWTLPPATAGRLAQRYHRHPPTCPSRLAGLSVTVSAWLPLPDGGPMSSPLGRPYPAAGTNGRGGSLYPHGYLGLMPWVSRLVNT